MVGGSQYFGLLSIEAALTWLCIVASSESWWFSMHFCQF